MKKYIDADRLKKAVEHELDMQDTYLPAHFFDIVDDMPAADVAEVRHGRWIIEDKYTDYRTERCSACGFAANRAYIQDIWHYCPNCGSRMDLDGDTE